MFTAETRTITELVVFADELAVKELKAIEYRRDNPPSTLEKGLSLINPFSALTSGLEIRTEADVKQTLRKFATEIADDTQPLLAKAFDLRNRLEEDKQVLKKVGKAIGQGEKSLPYKNKNEFGMLWERVMRPEDFSRYKDKKVLLQELTNFNARALEVIQYVIGHMNGIDSEMRMFRQQCDKAASVTRDYSAEQIVEMIATAARRTQAQAGELKEVAAS